MPSVLGYLREVLVPYYKEVLTLPTKDYRTDDVVTVGGPVFLSLFRSLQFPGLCFPITSKKFLHSYYNSERVMLYSKHMSSCPYNLKFVFNDKPNKGT